MTEGYIYCFSNPSMPGILKVGMTERTPDARLSEANASDTWKPPTPYVLVFAKGVVNPLQKEKALHRLLEKYAERIHPRREFFRISPEDILLFLDLIDGTMWSPPKPDAFLDTDEDGDAIMEMEIRGDMGKDKDNEQDEKYADPKRYRTMNTWFVHGQRIGHLVGKTHKWIGTYDSTRNEIVCDGISYRSLSGFATAHYRAVNPRHNKSVNGWKECYFEVDGTWIETDTLPKPTMVEPSSSPSPSPSPSPSRVPTRVAMPPNAS